jgi:hypothetical protein
MSGTGAQRRGATSSAIAHTTSKDSARAFTLGPAARSHFIGLFVELVDLEATTEINSLPSHLFRFAVGVPNINLLSLYNDSCDKNLWIPGGGAPYRNVATGYN